MDFTFNQTNITGGFWKNVQDKNKSITINAVYERFKDTGRIEAMACKWKEGDDKKPHIFWDSDVAKWIEGAAYIIAKNPNAELEARVEAIIEDIENAQLEDGYYNIYYICVEPNNRLTARGDHELYCLGHLIEAAIAYYYATGRNRLLKVVERYVDFVYRVFVEEDSAKFTTPGHEEIELALLRLYKTTGSEKALKLCGHFLDVRGTKKDRGHNFLNSDQSKYPVRTLKSAEGHSVRALYLYSAMVDYAYIQNDKEMLEACHRLYDDIVNKKMYITGGVGSTRYNEAFTVPYDLPNSRAYTETCAAISLMFFCQRLLENESKAEYADVIERVMYNGMLSGLSLSGDAFFYSNPLEISLIDRVKHTADPNCAEPFPLAERIRIFECSCCAPNLNRVLPSLERYFYHKVGNTVYVDQFGDSEYSSNGIKVVQSTSYPLNGKIKFKFENVERVAIRIPAWCENASISSSYIMENGYAVIDSPHELNVEFEIAPVLYSANKNVNDDAGRVALMLGPVVYCAERVDNDVNLHSLCINEKELSAELEYNSDFNLNALTVNGYAEETPNTLYSKASERSYTPVRIRMIPFYAFANRGASDMLVWLRGMR